MWTDICEESVNEKSVCLEIDEAQCHEERVPVELRVGAVPRHSTQVAAKSITFVTTPTHSLPI